MHYSNITRIAVFNKDVSIQQGKFLAVWHNLEEDAIEYTAKLLWTATQLLADVIWSDNC
jgi:hypothetical protein